MTLAAEAPPLTANIDFERAGETWRRIPVADVPTKPLISRDEALSGSVVESSSGTQPAEAAFAGKVVAHRPVLFAEQQAPELPEEFLVLQDWEGAVDAVGSETFTARLRDRTSRETYAAEIAELPIADVSDDDRELLRPGAVFYLTVGRVTRASGRQDRVGRLVFRRLPAWTEATLRRAEQRAERLRRFLTPQS